MDLSLLEIKVKEEISGTKSAIDIYAEEDPEDDVFIEVMDTDRYVEGKAEQLQYIDLEVDIKKEDDEDITSDKCKTEINANCVPLELECIELQIKAECNTDFENESIDGGDRSSSSNSFKKKPRFRSKWRCYRRRRPKEIPLKEKWFECTACPYRTKYSSNLVTHQLVHNKTGKKPLFCYNCEYKTYRKHDLISHMYKHSRDKKVYNCNSCSHRTFRKHDLKAHILRIHGNEDMITRKFSCSHCGKGFKEKRAVEDHTIKCHPSFIHTVSSKILECGQCSFKTTYKSSLTQHMHKLKHCLSEAPVYTCNICNYVCYFKHYFNAHLKSHTKAKRYSCSSCGSSWTTKLGLDDHILCDHQSCDELMNIVTCKIYNCEKCNYMTGYLLKLKKHVKLHHI